MASRLAWWLWRPICWQRAVDRITGVIESLTLGHPAHSVENEGPPALQSLAAAVNALRAALELERLEGRSEQEQLQLVLNGMSEGILVTDARGRIQLMNRAARQFLDLDGACVGATLLECCRNTALEELIRNVGQTGCEGTETIAVPDRGVERMLKIHTVPLRTVTQQRGAVSVLHDITEQRRVETIRREFVANVSHELKTPLTSIRGYAETLRRGAVARPEEAGKFVEKIERNAIRLQGLVEDMLTLAECETGRLALRPEPIAVKEVVECLRADSADHYLARGVQFLVTVPADYTVTADPTAFQQIVGNLIENAVQYTPDGGTITVSAIQRNGHCAMTVSDTGVGIAEQELPRIYERFYRGTAGLAHHRKGSGLGLAIVKHLVQAHGGEVGVTSTPGHGSQFTFTLPLRSVPGTER